MLLKKKLKSGSHRTAHVAKFIYQMSVLSKFLGLYLFFKYIQGQSTRDSIKGHFPVGVQPVYGRTL